MSSAVTLMILKGIGETLLMVLCSTLFGYLFGLPLGVLLCISDEGGIRPNRILYRILDIADLTVDGSICTGACVCAVLIAGGSPVWLAILLAVLAGALAGTLTGLLHTALGIPSILAGILTQLML